MNEELAERKLATVLFADLVSSTELGASQDPERTRAMLDRFYDAMAEEISRAGGTVEKFAGDAVMAAFGVPVAHEDHVERALHAALAMQRRLEGLFGTSPSLRIGINAGEVVVGRARETSSFVTGDVVNVAARLEQAAERGDILVGERAAALVTGAFEFGPRARVEAKGKPEGVECRRLVRALSLMRPRGVPGLKRAFVGRDHELDALRAAYEHARNRGQPQLVTIVGEPGVGKTRLVRETWEWLGHESVLRRTGRCPPYGRAQTYEPIGEIVKEQFGILDSDSPERVLALLEGREILALALGLEVTRDLHPIEARDRLHDTLIELVAELAAEQPLALLVEDLHWAEDALLELLERLVLEVSGPLLVLATSRPEFLERRPTWGRGRAPSEWIWLEPLEAADVERWLEESVGVEAPPQVRGLLDRAEGNPLFLEELVGTLIEHGILRDGAWNEALVVPGEVALPDTVQAMLAARIDLLSRQEKAALRAAAVIGRAFWPSAVRAMVGEGDDPDFRVLEQRDFVRRQPGSSREGEREFVFKHALTREVAYTSLTRRERAHLHAEFGAWLERHGGVRDEHAALLAHHYSEAVRPEDFDLAWSGEPDRHEALRVRAVSWLRRAAELAAGRYEIEDALALLGRALELETQTPSKIEILRQTGHVHTLRFDPQGFRKAMEEALARKPTPAAQADIYAQLAYYSLGRPYMWKELPPRAVAEQWLAKAIELSPPDSAARGWALVAQALSDPAQREEAGQMASRLGEALGDARLVVYASEARGLAATEAGRYGDACKWADRALAAAPTQANPGYASHLYWNAAFVYARAGRFAEARRFAKVCDRIASSLTVHEEVHAVAIHAAINSALGEWKILAELGGQAEATSAANEDFPCQFNWRNLLVCALGRAQLGDERGARRLEELGRSTAVVVGPPEREPALLRLALLRSDEEEMRRILELLPAAGDPWSVDAAAARLDALMALDEPERIEEEAGSYLEEESYMQPFALRALGVCRGDTSLLREAESRFEAMGLSWRAEETRSLGPVSR